MKLLIGEIIPTKGEITKDRRLRVGVFNQHSFDHLDFNKTPVEYLCFKFSHEYLTYQAARNLLGKFGLNPRAHTIPIKHLSGGEKARVAFAELHFFQPDILILDEPTNNLDIEYIDVLLLMLKDFDGGILTVTHDEYLLKKLDFVLWAVEDKGVFEIDGDFDDYKKEILD